VHIPSPILASAISNVLKRHCREPPIADDVGGDVQNTCKHVQTLAQPEYCPLVAIVAFSKVFVARCVPIGVLTQSRLIHISVEGCI
jgi:hypothetical protein